MLLVDVVSSALLALITVPVRLEEWTDELSDCDRVRLVAMMLLLVTFRCAITVLLMVEERMVALVMVVLSMMLAFEKALIRLAFPIVVVSIIDVLTKERVMFESDIPDCSR